MPQDVQWKEAVSQLHGLGLQKRAVALSLALRLLSQCREFRTHLPAPLLSPPL